MPSTAAFRHDPLKYVLPGRPAGPSRWDREPAVCGHRRHRHHNTVLDRELPVPVSASPAVVDGVGAVFATDDGRIRFYDPTLSKAYWERRLDSSVYASLVVDTARRRVVVAGTSGLVTCFDLRGRLAWSTGLSVPVFATPTVLPDSDLLAVAGFHSRLFGLDLDSGAIVFDRVLPAPWSVKYGGTAAYRDPYASPATTSEGTVIVCCAELVLCLDAAGNELWRHDLGCAAKASPVALHETGQVAVCPVDGRCLFLDIRTGELQACLHLDAKITASPAVSGRVLAVGTQTGAVAGIDITTYERRWHAPQGAPRSYTSFTVLPSGDFVATADRGNVVCLRRDDGGFLWESSQVLGLPAHEPQMDITPVIGPDGSMYCASYEGDLYHFRFPPHAPTLEETQL
ncbi:PQQ-binding-like beta-propeller repeat protein [Streptomyces sp. NPDC101150]|uniref:outer membrane protein assembly factor BamB family protein n=1 Tax=Streptomyces sp. NPDC101150 TaxID=3366114 RepID=UPI003802C409